MTDQSMNAMKIQLGLSFPEVTDRSRHGLEAAALHHQKPTPAWGREGSLKLEIQPHCATRGRLDTSGTVLSTRLSWSEPLPGTLAGLCFFQAPQWVLTPEVHRRGLVNLVISSDFQKPL